MQSQIANQSFASPLCLALLLTLPQAFRSTLARPTPEPDMPASQPSPDAALFAALIGSPSRPPPRTEPDLADLVLRLAGSVRQTTAMLREASACLAMERGGPRLPGLLARAEVASLDQAECTAALIRHLAPEAAAA